MKCWYLVGAALLPLLAASLEAQVPLPTQPIDSGTLVRVHLGDHSVIRGRLLHRYVPGAPTLRLCLYPGRPCPAESDERVRAIPVAGLTGLDIAAGTHARPGAILGAIVGLGLGEAAYGFAKGMCESPDCVPSRLRIDISSALAFTVVGALVGGGLDAWRRAP